MTDKIKVVFSSDEIIEKIIEKENIDLDKHEAKELEIVIPSLNSKGSLDISMDYTSINMCSKLIKSGINVHKLNDFHDYTGEKNDKDAIAEHLSRYNTLSIKKEYDKYEGVHHSISILIYYKITNAED